MTKLWVISAASTLAALTACGGSAFTAGDEQGGNAGASMGSGGANSGGALSQGGVPAHGGAAQVEGGSAPTQGGTASTGGSVSNGGSSGGRANGGSVGAGGKGGMASGGSVAKAGAPGAGGLNGLGGMVGLGGIGVGTGGLVGAGGSSGTDCSSLWQNYSQEMQLARVCSLNSTTKQCSGEYMLYDTCGCQVPANGTSEHYTKALELYNRWTHSCAGPVCLIACPINEGTPTCKASSGASDTSCSF